MSDRNVIPPAGAARDEQGRVIRKKTIEHAHFNEAWIRARP